MNMKTFCIFSLILLPAVCFGGTWRVLDSRGAQKPATLNEVDFLFGPAWMLIARRS
jgi:hypothetical protein